MVIECDYWWFHYISQPSITSFTVPVGPGAVGWAAPLTNMARKCPRVILHVLVFQKKKVPPNHPDSNKIFYMKPTIYPLGYPQLKWIDGNLIPRGNAIFRITPLAGHALNREAVLPLFVHLLLGAFHSDIEPHDSPYLMRCLHGCNKNKGPGLLSPITASWCLWCC